MTLKNPEQWLHRPTTIALAAALAVLPLALRAQTATPPAPAASAAETASNAETTLPAIRVTASSPRTPSTEGTRSYTTRSMSTATGLGLSIRDTPQSVSVVTRQRIDDQGLHSITDVVNNVTGVSAKEFDSGRFGFSARGFDITNLQIDGIPMTWDTAWSAGETQTDLALYDRVEVVRGATGLTTGTGNPSAAINLVRKHATSKVFTGSAALQAGSWNDYRGTVDLSTPIDSEGRIRARVVASYQDKNSYMKLAKHREELLYVVLDADLSADTAVSLGASRQQNSPKGSTWGGLSPWYSDGTRTDWDRSATTAANWSSWGSVQETYFGNLEHRLDNGWKLRATLSHGQNDGDLKLLFLSGSSDRTSGLGLEAYSARYDTSRKQDDVSLQASGPFDLFGRKHELSVGLQHSEQKFQALSYATSDAAIPGSFLAWDGSYAEPTWGARSVSEAFTTRQTAGHAATRISLSDPLKLILGARATRWDTDGQSQFQHTKLTPYAGLVYDLSDTCSAYASYTDIFNPQNNRDRYGNYLEPLEGKSYEVGVKGEFLDGRLNAGFAVFHVAQDNLAQLDGGQPVPGTNPPQDAYFAAQGTKSTGYEFDVAGELSAGWNLGLGWTQFISKDAAGAAVNTNHPRRMLKVFSSYRLQGPWEKLVIGGGVNWESANYTMGTNPQGAQEMLEQPAFALMTLMTRYEFSPKLSAQLNINNLLDKKYYSQIGFYNQLAYGAPRNGSVALKYQF